MGLAPELEYSELEYSVDLALLDARIAIEVRIWQQCCYPLGLHR